MPTEDRPSADVTRLTRTRAGQALRPDDVGVVILPDWLLFPPQPVTVLRPGDLLLLRFSFRNLVRLTRDGRGVLVRRDDAEPAYLVVDLPSQHLVEEAFPIKVDARLVRPPVLPGGSPVPDPPQNVGAPLTPPPVEASLSWGSRVVLQADDAEIVYSLEGLLDAFATLPLSIAPHAHGPVIDVTPVPLPWIDRFAQTTKPGLGSAAEAVQRLGTVRRLVTASRTLEQRLGPAATEQVLAATSLAPGLAVGDLVERVDGPGIVGALTRPRPRPPTDVETSIELPWRLKLSPGHDGGFSHARQPVDHGGRVELWHSRLGVRDTSGDTPVVVERGATVRAVWSRDHDQFGDILPQPSGGTDSPGFTKSLVSRDRMMIVHETSDFGLKRRRRFWAPPAVDVDLLALSALGGWLRSDLSVPELPDNPSDPGTLAMTITAWKHRATMGRDHDVRVVYAGFLFPYGHAASLVKQTERLVDETSGVAYLRQRFYVVVRERTRTYGGGRVDDQRPYLPPERRGPKDLGRAMPLASVTVETAVTPDLDPPTDVPGLPGFCFTPTIDGSPFSFQLLGVDRQVRTVEYTGPVLFVERSNNTDGLVPTVIQHYWNAAPRTQDTGGVRVGFADATADGRELDTAPSTRSFELDAVPAAAPDDDHPRWTPILRSASVVVPSMSALAGADTAVDVEQPVAFLDRGWTANATHVFLTLPTSAALDFAKQADRSGGFVAPSLSVTALSGSRGPIGGDVAQAMSGVMDPATFFGGLPIPGKLFGAVPLSGLLQSVGLTPDTMPTFVADTLDVVRALVQDGLRLSRLADEAAARFGTESDATVQAVLAQLQAVRTMVDGAVAGLADLDSVDDAAAALAGAEPALRTLASSVGGATLLPVAVRTDAAALAGRLADLAAQAAAIAEAAKMLLGGFSLPPVLTARLSWSTPLAAWPSPGAALFQPRVGPGQTTATARSTLDLSVEVQAPTRPGSQPSVSVACSISPFSLRLMGDEPFISLDVDVLEFTALPGRKPDVNVVLGDQGVVFGGPLSFVNALRDVIPLDGFSDPPYLDVTAEGITAGFDLAIPTVPLGVMNIMNISLGAEARVPFIGDSLDFRFSFCTREKPFRLTVWLFGGGGFFAVTVTPEKCRMLEASFEFGACVAIDLGVASGSIEVMAGIYFRLEEEDGELVGYFRLRGEVDVLGLISACIELYLELSYEPPSGKAVGRATLTVEIDILFLSMSVEISCEKKLKGSNQDPSFEKVLGTATPEGDRAWDAYCAAFAPSAMSPA